MNPRDTIAISVNLPILRAVVALKDHQPEAAIEALEPAKPYQLRDYSVPYWRARAETEAGLLEPAAADYRLILDNPGINPISSEYPLARLNLAASWCFNTNLSQHAWSTRRSLKRGNMRMRICFFCKWPKKNSIGFQSWSNRIGFVQ